MGPLRAKKHCRKFVQRKLARREFSVFVHVLYHRVHRAIP